MLKIVIFFKNILLLIPITFLINPLYRFYYFLSNFNMLWVWIRKHGKEFEMNDYYVFRRNYPKRIESFTYLAQNRIKDAPILYLEFGVASGISFKWWLDKNKHPDSVFCGFDTFEGLPEDWNVIQKKGTYAFPVPDIHDSRAHFYTGLFQETLHPFIEEQLGLLKSNTKKVIHMDADLYSSTLFVLSQLYQYLKPGDLILFDEFNSANHEFRAFLDFTRSFYLKLKPVTAVNNYFQVAFEVE